MGSLLTPLEIQLTALIAQRASTNPSTMRVWVFGSRARGASTQNSDLDVAVEFDAAEATELRAWLETLRVEAEAPVVDQWPGFLNLVGLYANDPDPRLARRVRAEGLLIWERPATKAGRETV
jgi:predicted nucleotidyltransferase